MFLQLLGLPLDHLEQFLVWKNGVIRPEGAQGHDEHGKAAAPVARQIYAYFERAIDDHIANPRDDVLSAMIAAEIEGQPLSREELLDICFLFLIAGLDTVTDSLDCFFVYLARHPDHRRTPIEQPDTLPNAIEEPLRWETPVPGIARVAMQDVELSGCPISKGERVSPLLRCGQHRSGRVPRPRGRGLRTQPEPAPRLRRWSAPLPRFTSGPHGTAGSVARIHWRIPDYAIKPGVELKYTRGLRSVETLPLTFPGRTP